jgi:hypothetical protein
MPAKKGKGGRIELLIATHGLANLAGAPLHTLDLCRGFKRAGHDVSVFTLHKGAVSATLEDEGFPVYSLQDYRRMGGETFDLIYLYHATCEALLGLMFAGRVPIVRGYIGRGSTLANPVNGGFASAATYISEGVRELMVGLDPRNAQIPALIARNVYDDQGVVRGAGLAEPPASAPNLAVVSNHLIAELAERLGAASERGLCRFAHFGYPDSSVPITPELLMKFDAVITVGRTVLPTAALGKPVYLCDIHGVEGWLGPDTYAESQLHSFSGRLHTIEDWGLVEQQLLDTTRWPETHDLRYLGELVARDHALSRRVEQLEAFFVAVIKDAPQPVQPLDGYMALFNDILKREQGANTKIPGDRHRRRGLVKAREVAEKEAGAKDQEIMQLKRRLRRQREQNTNLEAQLEARRDPQV